MSISCFGKCPGHVQSSFGFCADVICVRVERHSCGISCSNDRICGTVCMGVLMSSLLPGVNNVRNELLVDTFIFFSCSQTSKECRYCCCASAVSSLLCCVIIVRLPAYELMKVLVSVGISRWCMKGLKSVG